MTGTRRLLFVIGCMICLLTAASALPAADPRLDVPGSDDESAAGDWESVTASAPDENVIDDGDDDETSGDGENEPREHPIEIDGEIEPGNEVLVDVDRSNAGAVEVNGEPVGEMDAFGEIDVVIPYEEEVTISVPETNRSRTVDVPTAATVETDGGAAPARDLEITAAVGSTNVTNATVILDGEAVATTDDDGAATVGLPETAGPVDIHVERGPVGGERTVDVAEPEIEFTSLLLFPGAPAPVEVSADGDGVPNANVVIDGEIVATTNTDGEAWIGLPLADEATVTTEVGAETATATAEGLYLRLTLVVVLVPGFLLGVVLTYLRAVRRTNRNQRIDGRTNRGQGVSLTDLFLWIADALATITDGVRRPTRSGLDRSISWPRIGRWFPSFPSFGGGFPSFGSGFPSFPSFGSTTRSSKRRLGSLFGRRSEADDDDESAARSTDSAGSKLAPEPLSPQEPRAEIRAAWHAFLDRLDVENRTTRTPGHVARRAIAAGFPATGVRRLLGVFRDVEYGNRDPSPDRIAEARATVDELLERDPNEEGSE